MIKNNNLENKYLDLNIRFVVSDTSGLGIKRTENELSKEYTDLLARAKDKGISYCKNNNLIFKETNIFSSRNDLSEPLSVSPYCLAKKKDYYDSCLRGGYEFHYTAYFLHFDCISADENQLSQGDLLHTEAERDKEFYKKLEEDKIKEFSKLYIKSLEEAYDNPAVLNKHLDDIKAIHNKARTSGMKVVLLAFPFLDSDVSIMLSLKFIAPLKEFFYENCKQGDIFIDTTPIAREYTVSERVVNFMDAHPSEKLHYRTAVLIDHALRNKEISGPGVLYCKQ